MKKFNKLLSVLLTVTLCLSLAAPAFAEGEPAGSDVTPVQTQEQAPDTAVTPAEPTEPITGPTEPTTVPTDEPETEPTTEPTDGPTTEPTEPSTTEQPGSSGNVEAIEPPDDNGAPGILEDLISPGNTLAEGPAKAPAKLPCSHWDVRNAKSTWETFKTTPATCTANEIKHQECSKCHETRDHEVLGSKLGHDWGFVSCAKKLEGALCTAGHQDNMRCSRCGEEKVRFNAAGHSCNFVIKGDVLVPDNIKDFDPNKWHTVECTNCMAVEIRVHEFAPATCTKPETCACGKEKLGSVALEHDWATEWTKDATDHWHVCTRNGCSEVEPGSKAVHDWATGEGTDADGWKVTKAATTAEMGTKERTCSECAYKQTADIPVVIPVLSVTLNPTTANVVVGETVTLTATVVPESATVIWTSSDESKATVASGVVTGVAETVEGSPVTITATVTVGTETVTATCAVTVTAIPVVARNQRTNKDYATLQAAVDEAESSDTIIMVADSDKPATIPAGKTITLNVNGFTLTNSEATGGGWGNSVLRNYGTLTINGGGTIKADASKGNSMVLYNYEGGTAILNGCTYINDNGDYTVWNQGTMTINAATLIKEKGGSPSIIINGWRNGGSEHANGPDCHLTINNCTIEGKVDNSIAVKNDDWGELVINGGSFSAGICLQNANIAEIRGGTFMNPVNNAARLIYHNPFNSTYGKGELVITGGDFYSVNANTAVIQRVSQENICQGGFHPKDEIPPIN